MCVDEVSPADPDDAEGSTGGGFAMEEDASKAGGGDGGGVSRTISWRYIGPI